MAKTVSVHQIPLLDETVYQVGQVIDIWSMGCGPEPWLMVNGFFTYMPQFVWSFIKPEADDLILDRMGIAHKRKRKRRFRVDAIDPTKKAKNPGLQKVLLRGAKLANRVGAFVLVVDATSDLLINWTSLAYTWSGCINPTSDVAQCWGGPRHLASRTTPGETFVGGTQAWSQGAAFAALTEVQMNTVGPKQWMATVSPEITPFAGIKGEITRVWLIVSHHGGLNVQYNLEKQDYEDGTSEWVLLERLWLDNLAPLSIQMKIAFTGGTLVSNDMTMCIYGAPNSALEPDP